MSDDSDSVQMLTRSSQIGEFYIMMPPQIKPTGDEDNRLHTADMLIYDEESDKHVRITWEDALRATMFPDLADDALVSMGHGKTMSKTAWMNAAKAIAEYSSGKAYKADPAEQEEPAANESKSWENLNKDIRIVVSRPFIEHLMHNVILTVSGRETGATLFGPADMQLSVS